MMHCRRILAGLLTVGAGVLLGLPNPSLAQPSADQLLTDMGSAPDDKARVLQGAFVTATVGAVSERDLSFAIAFLVKPSPDALSKQIVAWELISADAQVQAHGEFAGAGSLADLAGLKITSDEVKTLSSAPRWGSNFDLDQLVALCAHRGRDRRIRLKDSIPPSCKDLWTVVKSVR
jgi:hypothetical protein